MLAAAATALHDIAEQVAGCDPHDLGAVMGELAALITQAQAARIVVLHEATSRGVIAASDACGPAEWVVDHSGDTAQIREATALARVAAGCALPAYAELAQPVRNGRIAVSVADAVLREHGKLGDYLPEEAMSEALADLVSVAQSATEPQAVSRLSRRLMGAAARAGSLQASQDRLHDRRGLTSFGEDHLGLFHARLVLDPASHAIVSSALEALAPPRAETDLEGSPLPQSRNADQRRADALVEVCAAYAERGPTVRLGARARVVITMPLTELREGTGSGSIPTGEILGPETVRRMACDAAVIPVVLGSASEVLDVGREQRVVTAAQLVALHHRDGGCTFPGCSRPPGWCQAHHVRHWATGGRTTLENLALLCSRHHTVVHRRAYNATVSPTGVTWLRRTASPRPSGVPPP